MEKNIILLLLSFITATTFAQNVGLGTATPTNKLQVESMVTASGGATISGTNTGTAGSGIYGISHTAGTTGVQGTSNFGIGVYGAATSAAGVGIKAEATTGTALIATSVSGLALSISGNLSFSNMGNNTQRGAVMTSDASGNAIWKPKKIGFFANTVANTPVPISTFRKVEFSAQDFDEQNNFEPYQGSIVPTSSIFTAPVAGIYHFEASALFQNTTVNASGQIRLVKNASGTVLANYESDYYSFYSGTTLTYRAAIQTSGDFHLNANDKVWVEVAQRNTLGIAIGLNTAPENGRFSGYLKIAD
jgi:C1q domain